MLSLLSRRAAAAAAVAAWHPTRAAHALPPAPSVLRALCAAPVATGAQQKEEKEKEKDKEKEEEEEVRMYNESIRLLLQQQVPTPQQQRRGDGEAAVQQQLREVERSRVQRGLSAALSALAREAEEREAAREEEGEEGDGADAETEPQAETGAERAWAQVSQIVRGMRTHGPRPNASTYRTLAEHFARRGAVADTMAFVAFKQRECGVTEPHDVTLQIAAVFNEYVRSLLADLVSERKSCMMRAATELGRLAHEETDGLGSVEVVDDNQRGPPVPIAASETYSVVVSSDGSKGASDSTMASDEPDADTTTPTATKTTSSASTPAGASGARTESAREGAGSARGLQSASASVSAMQLHEADKAVMATVLGLLAEAREKRLNAPAVYMGTLKNIGSLADSVASSGQLHPIVRRQLLHSLTQHGLRIFQEFVKNAEQQVEAAVRKEQAAGKNDLEVARARLTALQTYPPSARARGLVGRIARSSRDANAQRFLFQQADSALLRMAECAARAFVPDADANMSSEEVQTLLREMHAQQSDASRQQRESQTSPATADTADNGDQDDVAFARQRKTEAAAAAGIVSFDEEGDDESDHDHDEGEERAVLDGVDLFDGADDRLDALAAIEQEGGAAAGNAEAAATTVGPDATSAFLDAVSTFSTAEPFPPVDDTEASTRDLGDRVEAKTGDGAADGDTNDALTEEEALGFDDSDLAGMDFVGVYDNRIDKAATARMQGQQSADNKLGGHHAMLDSSGHDDTLYGEEDEDEDATVERRRRAVRSALIMIASPHLAMTSMDRLCDLSRIRRQHQSALIESLAASGHWMEALSEYNRAVSDARAVGPYLRAQGVQDLPPEMRNTLDQSPRKSAVRSLQRASVAHAKAGVDTPGLALNVLRAIIRQDVQLLTPTNFEIMIKAFLHTGDVASANETIDLMTSIGMQPQSEWLLEIADRAAASSNQSHEVALSALGHLERTLAAKNGAEGDQTSASAAATSTEDVLTNSGDLQGEDKHSEGESGDTDTWERLRKADEMLQSLEDQGMLAPSQNIRALLKGRLAVWESPDAGEGAGGNPSVRK